METKDPGDQKNVSEIFLILGQKYHNVKVPICYNRSADKVYLNPEKTLTGVDESNNSNLGDDMRFVRIPKTPPTVNKSIRFPTDVIEEVERTICGKECTFTAFVVEAVKIMLEYLGDNN